MYRTQTTIDTAPAGVPPVDCWKRLERFLTLGREDGWHHAGDWEPEFGGIAGIAECLRTDGVAAVRRAVECAGEHRSFSREPALFVLALAASPRHASPKVNAAALAELPGAARTGSDLCAFAAFAARMRGWGRGLRSAIAAWYLEKSPGELVQQMLSSQPREGWSHRDLLRLAHPVAATPAHNAVFQWAVEGGLGHLASVRMLNEDLRSLRAFELAKQASREQEIVQLIEDCRMTAEMVPARWKNSPQIWEALLETMSYQTLVRNLGWMTAAGLAGPRNAATALVVARLIDRKRVVNSRLDPMELQAGLAAYESGAGGEGELSWTPSAAVAEALGEAIRLAYANVQPSGRRICLAVDPKAAAQQIPCRGASQFTVARAASALAARYARTEPNCTTLEIDPALVFRTALDRKIQADAFVVMKVAAGDGLGDELRRYREATGIGATLAVIHPAGADRSGGDTGEFELRVSGFDERVPGVVSRWTAAER